MRLLSSLALMLAFLLNCQEVGAQDVELKQLADSLIAQVKTRGKSPAAIMPFVNVDYGPTFGNYLVDRLIVFLSKGTDFELVARDRVEETFSELNLALARQYDSSTFARIGKRVGAQSLIRGSYTVQAGAASVSLVAQVIDVESGRVIGGDVVSIPYTGDVKTMLTQSERTTSNVRQNTDDSNRKSSIDAPSNVVALPPSSQETSWFKASVRRLIVQANGDVVAFMEYSSKRPEEYHVGLSGCASDWRVNTYLVDNAGNTFYTKSASGIGYVDCGFINDPVHLTPGGTATFSIVFARPSSFERRGTSYSLSSAQHVGRIGADGRWRNVADVNISLMDIKPIP